MDNPNYNNNSNKGFLDKVRDRLAFAFDTVLKPGKVTTNDPRYQSKPKGLFDRIGDGFRAVTGNTNRKR